MHLPPKYEAAVIAYVALYDNCEKLTCWQTVGEAIRLFGSPYSGVVYRGHASSNTAIRRITPFFSTTPQREMAELFVETQWKNNETGTKIGHLFKIHLRNAPVLQTDKITYTFSPEVISELRKLNGAKMIEKGSGSYTFDEYLPQIEATLRDLVFNRNSLANDTEVLVLNGGTFYASAAMSQVGYTEKMDQGIHTYETWYSFDTRENRTRRRRRRRLSRRR
jgi:hypothetical protein